MNYGYNLAASGVAAAMFRQDVAANNLANIETTGFKPDMAFTVPREAARVEDRLFDLPSNRLLERLGAGVLLAPTRTAFTQGALSRTGNPLDIAIDGPGFMTVAGRSGDASEVRLTRDGRLTLNADHTLVTASDGHEILDDAGRPIRLAPGATVEVGRDGVVRQDGAEVARIRLVAPADPARLRKIGHNLYAASASVLDSDAPTGQIVQGHIERSAVDPIQAMMAVQNAASAVTSSMRVLSIHDETTGRLINSLGRVSA